jgi:DNA replication protein DnaC
MGRRQSPRGEPDRILRQLKQLAMELDLTALPDALDGLLLKAEQEGLSFSRFALELLETERQARRERKLARSLKRSRLGPVQGIDGYDFAARPKLEARVIRELLTCRFVEERRNVICVGRPGLGKTRIAKALAASACLNGYSVLFTTSAEMLETLQGSLADHTYQRTFRRYTKPAVLVLDEFGYEAIDSTYAKHLFRIVSARHDNTSTILTANTGFTKWKHFFPSEAQAVATVDRLVDRATILRFTGRTFRDPQDIHGAPLDE